MARSISKHDGKVYFNCLRPETNPKYSVDISVMSPAGHSAIQSSGQPPVGQIRMASSAHSYASTLGRICGVSPFGIESQGHHIYLLYTTSSLICLNFTWPNIDLATSGHWCTGTCTLDVCSNMRVCVSSLQTTKATCGMKEAN